ncbi:MAG: protein kinase [Anaerolineales bacterium]|nr:protein kinase [Anaerolineales bacterium]
MNSSIDFIGKNIGDYKIVKHLGNGCYTQSFLGQHLPSKRIVVFKILNKDVIIHDQVMDEMVNQLKKTLVLQHPNICQIFEVNQIGPITYYVEEFVEGQSLRILLNQIKGKLTRTPVNNAVRIIQSIAIALSYAHKKGIVHGNLRPESILVEKTGRVVVNDFGEGSTFLNQLIFDERKMVGYYSYMPPETILEKRVSPASDIYSLGIIFYELITGKLPFYSEEVKVLASMQIKDSIKPPGSLFPEIPSSIDQVISSTLAKKPDQRYPSIDGLINDLNKINQKIKTMKLPTAKLKGLEVDISNTPAMEKEEHQISLHFLETGQIINLDKNREYIIGRRYKQQPVIPDIDLTPFKAYDWGISRLHAKVIIGMDNVKLVDMGSSNGTWVKGEKIRPGNEVELKHGDVFLLGRLSMQILIYL